MKRRFLALIVTLIFAIQLSGQTTPRVLIFAEHEYSRLQIKVKGGSYTLTAYTPDSVFTMDYGPDDVHPLYTFRGDLRLNRAGCDSTMPFWDLSLACWAFQGYGRWASLVSLPVSGSTAAAYVAAW